MLKITPTEMHELVTDTAAVTWSKFRRVYPKLSADVPLIKYNNRLKTTAGRAFFEKGFIDISTALMWEHGQSMLEWTIPHEFGHLVAFRIFGDTGHGADFKRVMLSIGADPSTFHNFQNTLHETRKLVRMTR